MDDEREPAGRDEELLGGATTVLALQLLGVGLGFGLQVVLARGLGAESYGVYVYALRWLGLLAVICQAGWATGSLRFVPAYLTSADWPRLAGFFRTSWRYVMASGVAVGLAAWGLAAGLVEGLSDRMLQTLGIALLALPLSALLTVWSSALRGLGRVVLSQLPAAVLRPALLATAVGTWLAVGAVALTAPVAMTLHLLTLGLLVAWTGVRVRRALPAALAGVRPSFHLREWRRVMRPLMLQNLLGMALQRLDVLLIGVLLGVWEVALYAAASRVAGLMAFGRKAVNAWAAPEISRLHATGEPVAVARLVRRASRVTCGLSLPIAAVLLLASREVLDAFGTGFAGAQEALGILVVGYLATSLIGPASFLLTMTGGEKTVVGISAAILVPTAILHLILIPAWGLTGAAVAAASARFGHHLVLAVAGHRRTGARATVL